MKLETVNSEHGLVFKDDDGKLYVLDNCMKWNTSGNANRRVEIDITLISHNGFVFSMENLAPRLTSEQLMEEILRRGLLETMREYKKSKE